MGARLYCTIFENIFGRGVPILGAGYIAQYLKTFLEMGPQFGRRLYDTILENHELYPALKQIEVRNEK